MIRWIPDLIPAVCMVLLTLPVSAQNGPEDTFTDSIDVRVINIETVVTDGKGNRVPGLGPDDFQLLVDGREVEIGYFSEIRDGRALTSDNTDAVAAVLPLPDAPEPDVIPTHYLVFVDDVFARGAHRNLVLKKLAKQVDDLGPADRMAIMAFDGRRLEPLADWTGSREALHEALRAAAKRPAAGEFRIQERRTFVSGTLATATFFSETPFSSATGYASLLESQLRATVGAASTAMRIAGRPEGRKVMLLLSGGWPYEVLPPGSLYDIDETATFGPGTDYDPYLSSSIRRMNTMNHYLLFPRGRELYELIIDTANRMSYTVYPVDVPGLGWTGADVYSEEPRMTAPSTPAGIDRESQDEGSLMLIANQTGGRALLNDLRLDALDKAASDTRSYYWLGFQVEARGDDQRHEIEVRTQQKGLNTRARKNYLDLSSASEAAMDTEAALYLRKSDDHGLIVSIGEVQEVVDKQVEVPLRLSIPVNELTILPSAQGWAAHLEVHIQARDDRANVSDLQVAPINLLSETEPKPGTRTFFETWITLRDQGNDLAVTVRDLNSENRLTTFARVDY